MRPAFTTPAARRIALSLAVGAVVFFARAWLVRCWGSPLPLLDQWDAEALELYLPWLQGTFDWTALFHPHNEHRIVFTRLADLALFSAAGGWNIWLQLLLNAALHATTAAALTGWFYPELSPRARAAFATGMALFFSATFGWQNALWGFQSQFYFANLFAVAAFAGVLGGPPLGLRWWLGWIAGGCALFSNASGLLVVLMLGLASIALPPPNARGKTGLLLGALVIAGFALLSQPGAHAALHAQTFGQFWQTLGHCLAWPNLDRVWLCVVMQLPLAWLGWVRWRAREPLSAGERVAFALGAFTLLQAAALAYSRGAVLPDFKPLSRYQDGLLLGAVAQFFAGLQLARRNGRGERIVLLVWCGCALAGLIGLTQVNLPLHLRYKREMEREGVASVRAYLFTRDATGLGTEAARLTLHPDPRVVQRVLDEPLLRAKLPEELRAPPEAGPSPLPWPVALAPVFTALSGAALLIVLLLGLRKQGTVDQG